MYNLLLRGITLETPPPNSVCIMVISSVNVSTPVLSTAPWLNGRPIDQLTASELQENADYESSVELGDVEFEAEISPELGSFGESLLKAESAIPVLDAPQTNLLGTTYTRGSREKFQAASPEKKQELIDKQITQIGVAFGDEAKAGKQIKESLSRKESSFFTFGELGNVPSTQAHEIRHMAIDAIRNISSVRGEEPTGKRALALKYMKNNIPSRDDEETWNLQFDNYRSRDKDLFKDLLVNTFYTDSSFKKGDTLLDRETFDKAVRLTSRMIGKNSEKFATLEAAAQVYEGQPQPKGSTWKEFYLKQFLGRQRGLKVSMDKVWEDLQ